jgi:hypothetical protein
MVAFEVNVAFDRENRVFFGPSAHLEMGRCRLSLLSHIDIVPTLGRRVDAGVHAGICALVPMMRQIESARLPFRLMTARTTAAQPKDVHMTYVPRPKRGPQAIAFKARFPSSRDIMASRIWSVSHALVSPNKF